MGMSLTGHAPGGSAAPRTGHQTRHQPLLLSLPAEAPASSCGWLAPRDVEDVIRTTTSGRIAASWSSHTGVGGFITPPPEYFKIVADIIRHYGGCSSAMRQTGFGAPATSGSASNIGRLEPDIMTILRGIANGFPLGNTMSTPEIAASTAGAGLTINLRRQPGVLRRLLPRWRCWKEADPIMSPGGQSTADRAGTPDRKNMPSSETSGAWGLMKTWNSSKQAKQRTGAKGYQPFYGVMQKKRAARRQRR